MRRLRVFLAVGFACVLPVRAEDPPSVCGKTVDGWIAALRDKSSRERWCAARALADFGPAARRAVPELIEALRDDNEGLGASVVEALVRVDPEGTACIPALVAALDSKDSSTVGAAARALGLLGPRAKDALPALAKALAREFPEQFGNEGNPLVDAAKALGRIGPDDRTAIPTLIRALRARHVVPAEFGREQDEIDYDHAAAAARVLGSLGPRAKASVPTLIDVLRTRAKDDDNWALRREAALALGRIGPEAKAAIPVLRKALDEVPPTAPGRRDTPPQVSDAAAVALFHLAPDGKALADAWVRDSATPVRRAFVLGAMGRTSLEGESIAGRWLKDLDGILEQGRREGDETLFVEGYLERLGDLGVGAEVAVARLNELGKHRNPWIRQWAGEALGRIRPAGQIVR